MSTSALLPPSVSSSTSGSMKGGGISLLVADEIDYTFYFGRINEGTLYTYRVVALQVEHIAFTDKLLCTRTV